jgi:hypothetical protein
MAEKSSLGPDKHRQKLVLVWRNRKTNYQRLLLLTVLPLNYFMLLHNGSIGSKKTAYMSFPGPIYNNSAFSIFYSSLAISLENN